MNDLVIIGAGAAGLFAAANVPSSWKTLVLEKSDKPGRKLLLTGSGQCNLTNNEPVKEFLTRYGDNGKNLRKILFHFSNIALMSFFKQNALPLSIREDAKVFPASMKSEDVLNLLLGLSKSRNVDIKYQSAVTEITRLIDEGDCIFSIKTGQEQFFSKRVLVATGGESYPQTGSDGSFFTCLEQLGLNLIPRKPALVSITVRDYPYRDLSGLTFSNTKVSVAGSGDENGKRARTVEGGLLFTHNDFSGPAVLKISRYAAQGDSLTINYLPHLSSDTLRSDLLREATGDARQIVTLLASTTALPRSFLELICHGCHIEPGEKSSRLSGKEMRALAERLTADRYIISGTGGFNTAMVTAGGVSLDEVNLRTMEAKNYPGLYFAGEVLDVDGDTGGYNLQFAFSSAMLALQAMSGDDVERGCEK